MKRVQSATNKDIEQVYLSTYQYIEPDIFVNISMRKSYLAFILKEAEKTRIKPNQTLIEYVEQLSAKIKPDFDKYVQRKMIELSKVGYKDVIDDMLLQRSQMHNTYDANQTVEETLYHFKYSYIYLNKDIRETIGKNIGQADLVIEPTEQMIGLDNLIKQSIIPRDITLWRAATPYDFALREMDTETFLKTFYNKGDMFQIPIYPETSLDFALPKDFAVLSSGGRNKPVIFKYNVQGGTEGIYMERLGDKNWMNNSEEEVLLGRNLIGKFKSHTSYDAYELIEVDIIPKENVGKNTVHKFWEEAPIEQRW